METKEPETRVKAQDLGEGRGVNVSLSRRHLEEAGIDPDADIEVNRYAYDDDSESVVRLRLYEIEE